MGWTADNRGSGNDKTSANSFGFSPASNLGSRSVIILRLACDNSAASGAAPVTAATVTDSKGNTWQRAVSQNRTPGSVVNDGVTVSIWYTTQDVAYLTTSDTITVTFNAGVNVPAKAWVLTEFQWDGDVDPIYSVVDGNANGGSGTGYTITSVSLDNDQVIVAAGTCQGTAMGSDDTDTTRGSWSTGVTAATSGSTAATNVAMRTQHKVVNATGTQTHNFTISSAQWAGAFVKITAQARWTPKPMMTFV